jgi:putative transposon-encoded protein
MRSFDCLAAVSEGTSGQKKTGQQVVIEMKKRKSGQAPDEMAKGKVKFEVYGEEMLEKKVSLSGNSGRIYLPPDWVGHQVKIIRIN